MAHKRETLLAALVTQIKNAATSMGNKVYRGRRIPVEETELPACMVYQGDEQSSLNDFAEDLKRRLLEVDIEIHAEHAPTDINDPDIETTLNALSLEVEDALEADYTLGGAALKFEHVATETSIEPGEIDRGSIRLTLQVDYRTTRTDASI